MTKFKRAPLKSLAELPTRIRNKIRIEDPVRGERGSCWIWTGTFTAARQRFRHYHVPENRERYTDKVGGLATDRGTPKCRCPELGYAIPAHRVIYAETRGVSVRKVPRLARCLDDRCVSPWHCTEIGAILNRRTEPSPLVEPVPGERSFDRVLARLIEVNPQVDWGDHLSRGAVADECGLKVEDITDPIWAAFMAWQIENPDTDD